MRKIVKYLVICIVLSGCLGVKYTYDFEKGKQLDFSEGRWILNKPYIYGEVSYVYDFALHDFRKILGDSLLEIDDLRNKNYLIGEKIPYYPTKQQLENIRIGTHCDYIINFRVTILNDEIGSMVFTPPMGTVIKTNEARVEVLIYDLKAKGLISQASVVGKSEIKINADDSGGQLAYAASVIATNSIIKLVKQYKKNRID